MKIKFQMGKIVNKHEKFSQLKLSARMIKLFLNRIAKSSLGIGFLVMIILTLIVLFTSYKLSLASPDLLQSNPYPPPEGTATPYSYAYPGPESIISPTSTPITSSQTLSGTEIVSVLRLNGEEGLLEYEQIAASSENFGSMNIVPATLNYQGPLPTNSPSSSGQVEETITIDDPPLIDNWNQLLFESFEDAFPNADCVVSDGSPDGYERYWAPDDGRVPTNRDTLSAWPAKGGADGVDPDLGIYPNNLSSWYVCGPYDLSQVEKLMLEYSYWLETDLDGDGFFVGVSLDGSLFEGVQISGVSQGWKNITEHIIGAAGDSSVWVGWAFFSDDLGNMNEGVWLDRLEVWAYDTPEFVCGYLDPGNKGIVLPPEDPAAPCCGAPMIRNGDTLAVKRLMVAGVDWVRLGFKKQIFFVPLQDYDRMIDTLCANGISTLGLINHETLFRQDYNDPSSAVEYREDFTNYSNFLSEYYEGRVRFWEIWNEPNLVEGPRIEPYLYAPLLNDTYQAIKEDSPNAQILFGGLASAWDDSLGYLLQMYFEFDNSLGGVRPYDYFAIHPYPRVEEGPNPENYMYAENDPYHEYILDKFLEQMYLHNDQYKLLWITEIGWNSSKGLPNRPMCFDPVLVYETEQAAFLKPMFDILFDEIMLWNYPNPAIEKVVWYQYMDIGVDDPCSNNEIVQNGHVYISSDSVGGQFAWSFGLFDGSNIPGQEQSPKPVMCEFLAYPLTCDEYLQPYSFLPIVTDD